MVAAPLQITEKTGDAIGSYKLLIGFGEGACGVVYRVEQEWQRYDLGSTRGPRVESGGPPDSRSSNRKAREESQTD